MLIYYNEVDNIPKPTLIVSEILSIYLHTKQVNGFQHSMPTTILCLLLSFWIVSLKLLLVNTLSCATWETFDYWTYAIFRLFSW
jgi:hypothetical protein